MTMHRIILAGGSGFLGRLLARHLAALGNEVVVLSRTGAETEGARTIRWDGATLDFWASQLEGARAVLNLAGRSVNCRYHARNRRLIMDSRVLSTRALGEAIGRCQHPPRVWLNSSTATLYKHSVDRAMDEAGGEIGATPEAKDVFSVAVARAWERAFEEAPTPATRKVALRTAMVFSTEPGGVYHVLRRLAQLGLGGRMASGQQYVSWIHETDFCRAVEWLIDHETLAGPVNLAAPHPLPNAAMMRLFRQACGIPIGLPATRWMLEAGAFLLRTETELIVKSRRVVPARLLNAGFEFSFPELRGALDDLGQRVKNASQAVGATKGPPDRCKGHPS